MAAKDLNGYGSIPGNWEAITLPEAVFFQEGPGLRKWQWTDSGMKVINVTNILGDGSVDTNNTTRFISIEEYEKTYRHFKVDAGDIVVASSGNTYGKVGRISEKDLPLMMNTSVIRFRSSDPNRLNDDFLYAFLRSEVFKNQVESFVIGSAQPNFGPTHLKRMVMPIPPLAIQRRIAAILSAYDKLIENSQRRIKILEMIARGLYREWFVHFRFPGHEAVPCAPSPLGDIPKGWEVKKLGALVTSSRRATKPGPHLEDRRYVPIDCLPPRSLALLEAKAIEEAQSSLQLFEKGDILFGAMRPYFHKVVVAPFPGVTRTTCFVFKPVRPEWHAFATMTAFDEATVAFASAHSQGATIPYAVWDGSLSEMPLVLPSPALLHRFETVVAPLIERLGQSFFALGNLRRTRDLLLPRLLSGQIDVEAIAS